MPVRGFAPALPYTLGDPDNLPENAVDDVLPVRQYSQSEVTGYLDTIRNKAEALLTGATPKQWSERWIAEEELDLHLGCPSLVAASRGTIEPDLPAGIGPGYRMGMITSHYRHRAPPAFAHYPSGYQIPKYPV